MVDKINFGTLEQIDMETAAAFVDSLDICLPKSQDSNGILL